MRETPPVWERGRYLLLTPLLPLERPAELVRPPELTRAPELDRDPELTLAPEPDRAPVDEPRDPDGLLTELPLRPTLRPEEKLVGRDEP